MIIVMHLHRGEHGIVAMRCLGAKKIEQRFKAEVEFLVHPKFGPPPNGST